MITDFVTGVAIGVVAFLYASIGVDGATGYISVLAIGEYEAEIIKPVALCLNMAVAAISAYHRSTINKAAWRAFLPFATIGVPASLLGGSLNLPADVFRPLVGALLICASAYMAWSAYSARRTVNFSGMISVREVLIVGGSIGLLCGLTGFGGGTLLAPWFMFRGLTNIPTAAGLSALFNLVNSAAGAVGAAPLIITLPPVALWWLLAAIGGAWAGMNLGSRYLSGRNFRLILVALPAVAGIQILLAWLL